MIYRLIITVLKTILMIPSLYALRIVINPHNIFIINMHMDEYNKKYKLFNIFLFLMYSNEKWLKVDQNVLLSHFNKAGHQESFFFFFFPDTFTLILLFEWVFGF